MKENIAIVIAGVCLGWLEATGLNEQTGEILKAVLAVIASTTVLGRSFRVSQVDANLSFFKNLLNAEKSAWPLAMLLLGIVAGVVLAHFFKL